MAGDRETGVEVMQMEEGLDTGPIAMAEKLTITPDMTAGEAHDRLSLLGADLIGRALAALERGGLKFQPQAEEGVVYAKKIDKAEARVDFSRPGAGNSQSCSRVVALSRGLFRNGFRQRASSASKFCARLWPRGPESPAKSSTRRRASPAASAP